MCEGFLLRPLQIEAKVQNRGYSLLLQRRLVDFAADHTYGQVRAKLKEHYGLELGKETIRRITNRHAKAIEESTPLLSEVPGHTGEMQMIVQADGSMVPTVEPSPEREPGSDRRKHKQMAWKEYRLVLAYGKGKVDPVYGGTFGTVDEAGGQMLDAAIRAGMGRNTRIHGLGDGAPWVADQMERVFGSQAAYLVDYYHLCEYLAKASQVMKEVQEDWLKHAKEKSLRKDGVASLKADMRPYLEPGPVPDEEAPVRHCYRYINNREGQFNYYKAKQEGLPVGSGRIESGHRTVIQARLKRAGTWWRKENASGMIAMRINRANQQWESYWHGQFQNSLGVYRYQRAA